jgi:hypothetical protein
MRRVFITLSTLVAVLVGGVAPLAATAPTGEMAAHACCRRVAAQVAHQHGCGAVALRCCSTPRDRRPEVPAPPGHTAGAPDLVPLKTLNVLETMPPAAAAWITAGAFVASRLKLPADPLYLRHLVLLV